MSERSSDMVLLSKQMLKSRYGTSRNESDWCMEAISVGRVAVRKSFVLQS